MLIDGTKPIELDEQQKEAVETVTTKSLSIITCGPGRGKCVAAGSLIQTALGLQKIETCLGTQVFAFKEQRHLTTRCTELFSVQAVVRVEPQETITVITRSGFELTGTPEHPILISTGDGLTWCRLDELEPEHDFVALHVYDSRYTFDTHYTPDMCDLFYAFGLLIAEGCFTLLAPAPRLHLQEVDILERVRTTFSSMLQLNSTIVRPKNRVTYLQFIDTQEHIMERFAANDICHFTKSKDKYVPSTILRDSTTWSHFLSGLFDGDAGITTADGTIEYSTASKQMSQEVQLMLAGLGIWAVRSSRTIKGEIYWRLLIRGKDVDCFTRVVGSRMARKQKALTKISGKRRNTNVDIVPHSQQIIRSVFTYNGTKRRTRNEWWAWKREIAGQRAPSRARVQELCHERVDSVDEAVLILAHKCCNNVRWDSVKTIIHNIKPVSVYDLSVFHKAHNFVANGFYAHNTQCIKEIVTGLEARGKRVALCAPTGKAAKRMQELTGRPAKTIHRMLRAGFGRWGFNKNHKLAFYTHIIVDESSMLDTDLFFHLLQAIPNTTALCFVGDADQLPPVGPGTPFRDMIQSKEVPVVQLLTNHRTGTGSSIASNANAINYGSKHLTADEDFQIVDCKTHIHLREELPKILSQFKSQGYDLIREVQVLSPQKTTEVGVEKLNQFMRHHLNSKARSWDKLAVGDKVMQTVNDYQLGIFNGYLGQIIGQQHAFWEIDFFDDDKTTMKYPKHKDFGLMPAYCCTVHKFQGSEMKAGIMIVSSSHTYMLTRNLLYTGITRFKEKCVILGDMIGLRRAVTNTREQERYSKLLERILGEL